MIFPNFVLPNFDGSKSVRAMFFVIRFVNCTPYMIALHLYLEGIAGITASAIRLLHRQITAAVAAGRLSRRAGEPGVRPEPLLLSAADECITRNIANMHLNVN